MYVYVYVYIYIYIYIYIYMYKEFVDHSIKMENLTLKKLKAIAKLREDILEAMNICLKTLISSINESKPVIE